MEQSRWDAIPLMSQWDGGKTVAAAADGVDARFKGRSREAKREEQEMVIKGRCPSEGTNGWKGFLVKARVERTIMQMLARRRAVPSLSQQNKARNVLRAFIYQWKVDELFPQRSAGREDESRSRTELLLSCSAPLGPSNPPNGPPPASRDPLLPSPLLSLSLPFILFNGRASERERERMK